ncbi:MAG: hypothetical protein K0U78_05525, partial [Actinomycetia bacterium]|nr:hypothetical protein [Actinomycetes bacterium]
MSSRYADHVGRVGALAVILGVGAAIVSLPAVALADATGSAGSTDSARSSGSDSSASGSASESSASDPGDSSDGLGAGSPDPASDESVGGALQGSAGSQASEGDTDIADEMADDLADDIADEDDVIGETVDGDSDAASSTGAGSAADADADAPTEVVADPASGADADTVQDSSSPEGSGQEASVPVDTSSEPSGSSGGDSDPAASPLAVEVEPPAPEVDIPEVDEDAPAPLAAPVVDQNDWASSPAAPVGDQVDAAGAGVPMPVMTAAPGATAPEGLVAEVASVLGLSPDGGSDIPALAPLVWTAAAFARRDIGGENNSAGSGTEAGQTGEPTGPESEAGDEVRSAPPVAEAVSLGSCGFNLICDALKLFQKDITDGIADLARDVFEVFDPKLEPIAPAIGAAGFTLLSATLLGDFETVPSSIQDLATDVDVLQTISSAVADTSALASLPGDLQTAAGNAAAYFVEQSFGNETVADAMVPVFKAIPFPTNVGAVVEFIYDLFKDDFSFKKAFIDLIGQPVKDGLTSFLGDSEVQQALGAAATGAVEVLIGETTPSWATPTSPAAVGTYVGELVANAILGEGNPAAASVSTIVSDAVVVLLAGAGSDIADEAGTAIVTFLSQPGVDDALATDVLNLILAGLGGTPISGGGPLAPAADVAVTDLVETLLSDSSLLQTLGTAVTGLVTDLIDDSTVQQFAGQEITTLVSGLLGESPIAAPVGA